MAGYAALGRRQQRYRNSTGSYYTWVECNSSNPLASPGAIEPGLDPAEFRLPKRPANLRWSDTACRGSRACAATTASTGQPSTLGDARCARLGAASDPLDVGIHG